MTRAIFFTALSLVAYWSHSQTARKKEIDPSTLVDEIFAMQDVNINYQDLYENYLQLLSSPVDLNQVTDEQLQSLYLLDPAQIQAFLRYRGDNGPFVSVYELQSIPSLTPEVIQKLAPFVTVNDPSATLNQSILKRLLETQNNYLILRWSRTLETQRGYSTNTDSTSRYAGSPDQTYARFRVAKPGDFSLGFTLEKDAGESMRWDPAKKYYGFDYVSFHAQAINKGKINNIILGDYQAQFGQGIALGSVFGIGKNGEAVTTTRRSNLGFSPYTSLYEAGYFRGAAVTYQLLPNVFLHSMYSVRSRDGNINQDSLQSSGVASAFTYTGLHRTPTELANRSTISETNIASVLNFKTRQLDAGLLAHQTNFSIPLQRAPRAYNQFSFAGNQNTNVGGFLNYSFQNISFFSEWCHSIGGGSAWVAGLLASLTNKLDVSLHVRYFDRNFYSFYSNAFAEASTPQNERGLYWGWKYNFNKKYSISGYADIYYFPWLKYRAYARAEGSEWLIRFNYRPSKSVAMFLQAREETKERNNQQDANLYGTALATRRNYWFNIDYGVAPTLSFKTRIQLSTFAFEGQASQGSVFVQDATFNRGRLSFTGRFALFDTDNFDTRLYVYERDVWLAFSFPAYNGRGIRQYLMMQYQLTKRMDIWLRWAQTQHVNRDTIGSGGDTIIGNTENDVKFQLRLRL